MSALIKISRVQGMLVCVIVASILIGTVFVPRSNLAWHREIESDSLYGSSYVRDYRGFLYSKGYFDNLLPDEKRQFHNISTEGRHSNTVMPRCHHPDGLDTVFTQERYEMAGPFNYLKNYKNPCWYGKEKGNRSHNLLCIPYFYFIGTPKAGTTDLFWRIEMHPHVAPVIIKEQRWFDTVRFRERNKASLRFYIHNFDKGARDIETTETDTGYHLKIVGDGSPSTMYRNFDWIRVPGNEWCLEPRVVALSYIHHLLPTARLILLVRNPVDRLYSDYLFNAERSGANCTVEEFHDWAEQSIRAHTDCYKEHSFRYCLYSPLILQDVKMKSFSASIYSRLILDVLKLFPRNQLLVLQMEDYSANMAERLDEVFAFLGLDPLSETQMKKIVNVKQYNKGKKYKKAGPMWPVTRKMIYEFYRPFNEELAQILNDKKYLWLED